MRRFRLLSETADFFSDHGSPDSSFSLDNQKFYLWQRDLTEKEYEKLLKESQKALLQEKTVFCFPCDSLPKAFFFDMDATVIRQESIVELARAAGKEKEVSYVTERAMAGEIDFKDALKERVATLKGLSSDIFEKTIGNLTLQPGISELAQFALDKGIKLYLVSGGFLELAAGIGKELGFNGVHANSLEVVGGVLTGKTSGLIVDAAEKASFVASKMAECGWLAEDVVVVGDGANDKEMMGLGAIKVGFRPKNALIPYVNGAVFQGDHRLLAKILG